MSKGLDEQTKRILDNYKQLQEEAEETGIPFTFDEWEEVFEDRDPFEFL
jgi:hypothetical protein